MNRKKEGLPVLTDAELRVMNVVWDLGSATVADVRDALGTKTPYTSVLTVMRILQKKGFVRIVGANGRKFIFEPTIARQAAIKNAIRDFIDRFFNGSPTMLAANLLETQAISQRDKARMRKLIADMPDDD